MKECAVLKEMLQTPAPGLVLTMEASQAKIQQLAAWEQSWAKQQPNKDYKLDCSNSNYKRSNLYNSNSQDYNNKLNPHKH